jgi:ribosomal protein S12 methylthiotransferase
MVEPFKVYIDSANYLCEVNLLGYSMIQRYLTENDHVIVGEPSQADIIIINSCGFTKQHEDATINLYKSLLSREGNHATVLLFGCLIKINPSLCSSLKIPTIDFDEGSKFDAIFYKKIKFVDIRPSGDTKKFDDLFFRTIVVQPTKILPLFVSRLLLPFSKKLRRNYQSIIDNLISKNKILVEICRGCASNCKYCVIKKTRGGIRSRPMAEILDDIEKFYDPTKELFLVADDCSCYGMDINTTLIDLLYEIQKRFPHLWIDLDNINPYWLEKYSDDYLRLFSELHIGYATIPLQSGSNRIVNDMNRNYDVKKIQVIVKRLKKASPTTALYSHFIICYPEEKFIDFLRTIHSAMYFDLPIAFEYSAPKDHEGSPKGDVHSRFIKTSRMSFFMFVLNFSVLYRLLTLPNQVKNKISSESSSISGYTR